MDISDSFETLPLSMFQSSGDLSASFEDGFRPTISAFNNSEDFSGIPVDSERSSGFDSYSYCVIA
jgi:hypothetical protein